ncbi:MAG: 3-dehydroquinate synthase [Gammaproteobacteria bacterium]|jgi:3-dehydroquinate synthase
MKTLHLDLGERAYPIHIGEGLLGQKDLLIPNMEGRKVLIVSNETVAPLYLHPVITALKDFDVHRLVIGDGEAFKTLDTLSQILDAAMTHRLARDSTFIALGGGVVGDLTGFAASCFQRGIRYIQIPTTLLAQVDSSVGGKTAVNHAAGKNMIGAFHQPACVIADINTLRSLPERELAAGLAEVVKYGLIGDPDFFDWIERNVNALLARDPQALAYAIEQSCRSKAILVSEDERESGARALLNFGHTFGHAIEAGLGYGQWLHGEAVAAGMCMAAHMSVRLGWLTEADRERTQNLLAQLKLPVCAPANLSAQRMLELMSVDKKVRAGRLRLVLLRAIGSGVLSDDFDSEALVATLRDCRED